MRKEQIKIASDKDLLVLKLADVITEESKRIGYGRVVVEVKVFDHKPTNIQIEGIRVKRSVAID